MEKKNLETKVVGVKPTKFKNLEYLGESKGYGLHMDRNDGLLYKVKIGTSHYIRMFKPPYKDKP